MERNPTRKDEADSSLDPYQAVLASLEVDQLVATKSRPFRRRNLKGSEVFLLLSLRLYLLFMIAVVIYQLLTARH